MLSTKVRSWKQPSRLEERPRLPSCLKVSPTCQVAWKLVRVLKIASFPELFTNSCMRFWWHGCLSAFSADVSNCMKNCEKSKENSLIHLIELSRHTYFGLLLVTHLRLVFFVHIFWGIMLYNSILRVCNQEYCLGEKMSRGLDGSSLSALFSETYFPLLSCFLYLEAVFLEIILCLFHF